MTPDPVGTALGAAKAAGLVVNPLAGIAVIAGEKAVASDDNPCVAAIEGKAADGGTQPAAPSDGGGTVEEVTKGAEETIKGIGEGLNKGLKNLFGD